jgi:hypothetical protein
MRATTLHAGLIAILVCAPIAAKAQSDVFQPPINYGSGAANDPVARLQQKLESGKATLTWRAERGYLPALLRALNVSTTSQVLVFSKTSFQRDRISPKTPRAIYYSDDVYLGWCQLGEVMEVAAIDPGQGTMFYTLDQHASDHPRFTRQTDSCLQCHASSLTENIPGLIVRSVYPDGAGMPILTTNTYRTTFRSPLNERWGGWYVTGSHGRQRHMGNMIVLNPKEPDQFDRDKGANRLDLKGLVDTAPYQTGLSDIVALMVLEHQTAVQNQIVSSNYQTRLALRDQEVLDQLDGKPAAHPSPSIQHRIDSAAESLMQSLLFVDEAALTDPVEGTSGFTKYFATIGPRDKQGRSLRDLDLRRRMFKYPCSYLIYSAAFDALPPPAKDSVYRQLNDVLAGKNPSPAYAHLAADDRQAIREILNDTKPDWKKAAAVDK